MKEKMVYVVSILDFDGDGDDLHFCFKEKDARKLAKETYRYITAAERKNTYVCVSGWMLPVEKKQSAIDAFADANLKILMGEKEYVDPQYYYEIRQ